MQNLSKQKCDEIIILSSYSLKNRVRVFFTGPGRTKQNHKAECDINNIMARFLKTGVLDFTQKNQPRYGDCTGLEYQRAMLYVAGAKTLFNELPAHVRDHFENEPARFFDFVNNPRNREQCEELGLLKPEAVAPEPLATPPAPPPAKGAPGGSGPHGRHRNPRGNVTEGDDSPGDTPPDPRSEPQDQFGYLM